MLRQFAHKLGEDVTESLELVACQWTVVQHVREKYSCRNCEKVTQPPGAEVPNIYPLMFSVSTTNTP